jgi:Conserved protein/domain typically associated with flavoprotein oxygenases, DIM6/NTAB family
MTGFRRIDPYDFSGEPARMIGKDWTLITAAKGESVNTMTASWGAIGEMWSKPAAFTFIRPQRYTHAFVQQAGQYSIGFFAEKYRRQLALCGQVSGRDVDKIQECGFGVQWADGIPYIAQAHTVLLCQTMAVQRLDPSGFAAPEIDSRWYEQKDYHDLFIAAITGVLVRAEEPAAE